MAKVVNSNIPLSFSSCTHEQLLGQLAEMHDVLDGPRRARNPTEEAATNTTNATTQHIRFKLTEDMGATTGGQASANIIGGDGSALSPNEAVTVYDSMGQYSAAVTDDFGQATRIQYPTGSFRWEIMEMPGIGGGTDDKKVKVTTADATPEFLEDKFAGTTGSDSYNASNHSLVSFGRVDKGAGVLELEGYITKADIFDPTSDDELVACTSGDTPEYLEDKFNGVTGTPYDGGTAHTQVQVYNDGGTPEALTLYILKSAVGAYTDKLVGVNATDTPSYLHECWHTTNIVGGISYDATLHDIIEFVTISNDTEQVFVPTPRVLCTEDSGDLAEVLVDQFLDYQGADDYSSSTDVAILVSDETAAGADQDLRLYVPKVDIGIVKANDADTDPDSLWDKLDLTTGTAYSSGSHDKVYGEVNAAKVTLFIDKPSADVTSSMWVGIVTSKITTGSWAYDGTNLTPHTTTSISVLEWSVANSRYEPISGTETVLVPFACNIPCNRVVTGGFDTAGNRVLMSVDNLDFNYS